MRRKREEPIPIQISTLFADLEVLQSAASIEGGALVLLNRCDDILEMIYEGIAEPSWMGLSWPAQRLLSRGDTGQRFRTLSVREDCLTFVHNGGVEVRVRFG